MRLNPAPTYKKYTCIILAGIHPARLSSERDNLADIHEENCPIISISSSVSHEADTFTGLVRKDPVSTRAELPKVVTVIDQ